MLEEANKTEKSCVFKTNELCMFVGTSQDDEQALEFVKEKEGSNENIQQNIEAKKERPSDDWSTTNKGTERHVKFPNSTPIGIVELYRKLDLQRRELEKQRIYTQDKMLKKC